MNFVPSASTMIIHKETSVVKMDSILEPYRSRRGTKLVIKEKPRTPEEIEEIKALLAGHVLEKNGNKLSRFGLASFRSAHLIESSPHNTSLRTPDMSPRRRLFQKPFKVLVVDDDSFSRDLYTSFFRKEGLPHDTAAHGQEALDKVTADVRAYRLVLMDCEMPVMDGVTATAAIQRVCVEQGVGSMTVFGVSGNSGESFVRRCKEAGMKKVLTKPVGLAALLKMIYSEMDRQEFEDDNDLYLGIVKLI